jgi:hypothetical protein
MSNWDRATSDPLADLRTMMPTAPSVPTDDATEALRAKLHEMSTSGAVFVLPMRWPVTVLECSSKSDVVVHAPEFIHAQAFVTAEREASARVKFAPKPFKVMVVNELKSADR